MAAEDTDNRRRLFWEQFRRPETTILHDQSWGGNVAAKLSELYALDVDGARNYDGVLVTNGVLSIGIQAYQLRADLRPSTNISATIIRRRTTTPIRLGGGWRPAAA